MASRTAGLWRHALVAALAIFSSTVHALTPSQVFDAVKDSVVVIKSLDGKGEVAARGSGVLLPSGKIATNCHVIKDGTSFQVGRGKRFVVVTVYAGDDDKDICLLDAKDIGGKPATLGKASSLKIGEAVYAVGAPQGLELSLSDGIVSQLRGGSPPFIQTTAAISPGSSGGGLFDSAGRLVGFTMLYIDGGQNLNFAMPVEWLADLKPGIKSTGKQRSQIDWITRAAALEEKKDWPGLLAWGKQWVKSESDNLFAWFAIGYAHKSMDQHEQAIAAYRQALRINPEDSAAWYNLGVTYESLKRHDDITAIARQVLGINSKNTYKAIPSYDDAIAIAIAAYRQALRIDPEHEMAWSKLGSIYQKLERHDDAISAYRQKLRINPESGTWMFLGDSYSSLKRYDDAIAAYRQAVADTPDFPIAWSNLGNSYIELNRYDNAIVAYRQALRFYPEYADAWNNLAVAYYLSGNTTAALQAVKTLRTLDPAKADKLFNMIVPR